MSYYYRLFSKVYEIGAKQMCRDCHDFVERGSKILDLGCGSGIATHHFQNYFGADVLGVDVQDNRTADVPFEIIDGKSLPFEDCSFDITLINYVLHHSDDPEGLLKEAKRVSKRIIIFEDLPEGFFAKLRCHLHQNTFFGGERVNFRFKTRMEWRKLFERLDLKIIEEKRVYTKLDWFDPGKRILYVLTNENPSS